MVCACTRSGYRAATRFLGLLLLPLTSHGRRSLLECAWRWSCCKRANVGSERGSGTVLVLVRTRELFRDDRASKLVLWCQLIK